MTKKERAELERERKRADLAMALRWTGPVAPDVPPPESGMAFGWTFNHHAVRVWEAWSTSTIHGRGTAESNGFGERGPLRLYSTKLMALAAMRHELEKQAATGLLAIDILIKEETEK